MFISDRDLGVTEDFADGMYAYTLLICIRGPGTSEVMALHRGPFSSLEKILDSLLQEIGWVFLTSQIEDEVCVSFVLFDL